MRNDGTSPAMRVADFEFFIRLKQKLGVAGENAGLQSVGGVVDLAQCLFEIFVGLDGDDRAKNFLTVHFHAPTVPVSTGCSTIAPCDGLR